MKRIILSLFFMAMILPGVFAQDFYGYEAGVNISNYVGKSLGQTVNTTSKTGIKAGGIFDFHLGSNIYMQYGAFYVLNGYKESDMQGNTTVSVNTFEVPVQVLYKFLMPDSSKFFIGLGPYFAINLGGSGKEDGSGVSSSRLLNIGNGNNDDLRPFDFGIGFGLGYQLKNGLFIRGNYQLGIANLDPGGDANNTEKNTNYSVTIGFLMRAKKAKKNVPKK